MSDVALRFRCLLPSSTRLHPPRLAGAIGEHLIHCATYAAETKRPGFVLSYAYGVGFHHVSEVSHEQSA